MTVAADLSLPPGPSSPAWWQLLRYSRSPLSFLEHCQHRFGTPFTVRLAGYGPLVMLTDSRAVRDVFRGNATELHSGEGNEFLSLIVGPRSVLVLDEGPHARQRSALAPALRGKRMARLVDAMRLEVEHAVSRWSVGKVFRALPEMRRITLRVILRSIMGVTSGNQLDQFETLVENVLGSSRSRYALFVQVVPMRVLRTFGMPFMRRLRRLDQAVYALIEERRRDRSPRAPNILDDLLAAHYDDGQPPSDDEIRDALVTMMIAGYDTTAVALAWALEQIVPRQDVVEAIRDEAQAETSNPGAAAEPGNRGSILDAAIRESLRIRTILPFVVRLTKMNFTAGEHTYPPGVILCPCSHLIHRRVDLYPEPGRFDPQRFIDRKFSIEEWMPFGGGGRSCLGMAFAMTELRVILGTILLRVSLERPAGAVSYPLRRGLVLAPHDDLPLVLREHIGMRPKARAVGQDNKG